MDRIARLRRVESAFSSMAEVLEYRLVIFEDRRRVLGEALESVREALGLLQANAMPFFSQSARRISTLSEELSRMELDIAAVRGQIIVARSRSERCRTIAAQLDAARRRASDEHDLLETAMVNERSRLPQGQGV